jgi:uncharacterized protein YjiS (DUF1127 family)
MAKNLPAAESPTGGLLARIVAGWRAAQARRSARREIAALDQAALRDLGLGCGDLMALDTGRFSVDSTRRQR